MLRRFDLYCVIDWAPYTHDCGDLDLIAARGDVVILWARVW